MSTRLTADLLAWYDRAARTLPWRGPDVTPYQTLVSEMMLQQTRVETVIPFYARFLDALPDFAALAAAEEDQVLSLWSGLGYYSRARNLHRAAQIVVADHSGLLPRSEAGLRPLPGVGEYMAGAVGSIALGLDLPAVDGNLERVLGRVFRHPGGRKAIRTLAEGLLPAGRAGDFNQALMDVGATICLPRAPRCSTCPLRPHCGGAEAGDPLAYPAAKARKAVPERRLGLLGLRQGGAILLRRRPSPGLFGGLYDLLWTELDPESVNTEVRGLCEGLGGAGLRSLGTVSHTLTHMHLVVEVFAAEGPVVAPADARWVALSAVEQSGLGLSALSKKALGLFEESQVGLFSRP